jgi:eukaryotic-like serine/threonine-protein kinase
MPRAGDVVAGKYRIEEVIGEGGMGAVFAATHALTGKRVALKWMLPELAEDEAAVQRFMREAQAAGRIAHPNVVDIYDVGEHEGSTFLVMECLQGETLTKAFGRKELGAQQIIALLIPAMQGVAAAHRTGVVHRDLKPDNIFLCRDQDGAYREPKVLDFGISKVSAAEGQMSPRLTRTGAVIGTPYYMAPEQIRGLPDVDKRADVYALGVILYEALTGRVPFDGDTYSALVLEVVTGTPRRLRDLRPDVPRGLEEVVFKAMAREPDARFQDVESFARALEPYARGAAFEAERVDPSGTTRDTATPFVADAPVTVPVRRGSLGLVVVAAVVVLGGLGTWALSGPSDEAAPEKHTNVVTPASAAVRAGGADDVVPKAAGGDGGAAGAMSAQWADLERGPEGEAPAPAEPLPDAKPVAVIDPATPPAVEPPAVQAARRRARQQAGTDTTAPVPAAVAPSPTTPPRPSGRTGRLRSDEF